MTDTDLMKWGKYKGKRLIDVPADYLIWLNNSDLRDRELKRYIMDNLDV